MKQNTVMRMLSVVLAIAMFVCALPMTEITAFAADTTKSNDAESTVAPEKELTAKEVIEKEVAERKAITKDRSAGMGGPYAVYVDGKFYAKGEFSDMWNLAMEKAAYAKEDDTHKNIGKSKEVEFVLYSNLRYDSTWFGEKTMTVSNKIFTIDLNGYVLQRFGDNGSVIRVENNSVLTIMDSNPTKENAGNIVEYGKWSYLPGGSKKIKGGVICGGYLSTDDGGGLYIDGESVVYLTGGTIAGNKADVGSAVYLDNGSTLDMSRGTSQICYNYCAGTTSDGGTIFLRSDCTVIGGFVHSNRADDYGGGVRAKGGNILVKDVIVYDNKAEYGGGIYIERSSTGQTVSVSDCMIVGNYAEKKGGGVYVYDLYMANMRNCRVENNSADGNGGGVCVSDWTGTDLTISGKMLIRNNHISQEDKKVRNNLYLEGDEDLIVGTLSLGSEIWVGTQTTSYGSSYPIVTDTTTTSHLFFFADEDGYCIKYQNDPKKDYYQYLYREKGTRTENEVKVLKDYSTKQLNEAYKVETGEYKDSTMPLYKGYFEYVLTTSTDYYSASPFYYSDGYFLEDPEVYNKHLATMSINLAVSAFGRSTTDVGNNTYANHFANVKQLMADIGCADVNFFANEDYQIKPAYYGEKDRLSTIGVAISQKEIKAGKDSYTLVPIAIRGGGYEVEWASNVTIGDSGEAAGFSDAANQVYKHVADYIENYGLTEKVLAGNVKFWVVGYSRAGATANLTSKRLVDAFAASGNDVYGYTFEAPMGGVESAKNVAAHTGNGTYPTIHNTVNDLDFVTLVAPSEMGFMRYGVDHKVGDDTSKMIKQLEAINPYYHYSDCWRMAELSIIVGGLFGNGVLDDEIDSWDEPNEECKSMYTFLRWFFLKVQEDGLNISSIDQSRKHYSTVKPLAIIDGNNKTNLDYSDPKYNFGYSDMSVGEAAAELVSILMGSLTDEQMNELFDAVKGSAIGYAKDLAIVGGSIAAFTTMLSPLVTAIIAGVGVNEVYDLLLADWDTHSELKKAETINMLMQLLLNGENPVWDILTKEQAKAVAEGLPVVLWFALNFASKDYNVTENDDGMWGIPTFITNLSVITANHYQEVSVAWVRSNDSYYEKDLQAYTLDTSKITNSAPKGTFASATNTITLSAQEGSSIFYSVDGGESWSLYTKPVSLGDKPEHIKAFSIYRGVKSDVTEVSMNGWAGSLLGNGNVWFLIVGSAIIVGFCVAGIEVGKKRKKQKEAQ